MIAESSSGLYCEAGGFHIDPWLPVERAVVTHAHSDHASPGSRRYLCAEPARPVMERRLPEAAIETLPYGASTRIGDVTVSFHPAGHILGSAQVRVEHRGEVWVVSGDYKRAADPTCTPFEPIQCDVFISEATFGLPVFRHPETGSEIDRLLHRLHADPSRCVLVGAYALGKAQRIITELRLRGHDASIYFHGAIERLNQLYESFGVDLGELRHAGGATKQEMAGHIVIAPPGALNDRWSRRLPDPVTAMASGWMRIRQRARQKNVELPLVISDHADWCELTDTISELAPNEIWVTHGREEALVHWAMTQQMRARALELVGREDEDEG